MSNDFIRLAEAPMLCIHYPTCSACCIDLTLDGDEWSCPSCGTSWGGDASDGDKGTLYADWAGEQPGGPVVTADDAWQWGNYVERLDRHRTLPEFCAKPERPAAGGSVRDVARTGGISTSTVQTWTKEKT